MVDPFLVKNCFLAAIATGERAGSLVELRDKIASTDEGSLYFHFWGGRLHSHFTHPEYHNDFAAWAHDQLHDFILAERLAVIDPTDFLTINMLRRVLVDVIDNRLEELQLIPWTKKEDKFSFIRSQIIIFDTNLVIDKAPDLPNVIAEMASGSIFFHFIDAKSRTTKTSDDFSMWLSSFGNKYQKLIEKLESIDSYYLSLTELRHELYRTTADYFEEAK